MDLEELRTRYGEVFEVTAGDVTVYCVRPPRSAFMRYVARVQDRQKLLAACEDLVRDCAVHPTGQELEQLFERWPGATLTLAVKLAELAGAAEEARVKAL